MGSKQFSAVGTLQIILPHSVDHLYSHECDCEDNTGEERRIRVEDENEVVHIDHNLLSPLLEK